MKLFLRNVFLFGLTVSAVILIVEKLIERQKDEYSYKHDYLEAHLDDIKIMSLGHSHIADGINMIALNDSGFNTAIPSRNMYYDRCIVEDFVPRMKNLKTVIMPLGYNFQYIKAPEVHQKFGMKKYWGYEWPGDNDMLPALEMIGGSKHKVVEMLGLGRKTIGHVYDSLGHQRIKASHKDVGWQKDAPKSHPLRSEETKKFFIDNVRAIAAVCREHGVRLIVVSMPTWHTYYEKTKPEGRAELYAIVDSMRAVNPQVEYYNMMNDPRFVDTDFFNASHLNEDGALRFTEILKNEIL